MPQETILIIDDNPQFSQALAQYMLAPLGYHPIHAASGRKGLAVVAEFTPDLIMLDMSMPGMSGFQVLVALREADCRSPVIFMTAEGSEQIAVEAFRLGVRDYLAKPFTSEEMQRAINGALQEVRLTQEKERLSRNLIVSETIRRTMVTLSHYVNNYLTVLTGNLFLLQEEIVEVLPDQPALLKILEDSQGSATRIAAVLRILRRITDVEQTTYHGQIKMIDIEAALEKELAKEQKN